MRESRQAWPITHKLNVKIYKFVRAVITPFVLITGLLILIIVHFRGVLAVTTTQNNLYQGVTAYAAGPLEARFQFNAGTGRPTLLYRSVPFLSLEDWSSTISVDGHVENLWNSYHGYTTDDSKRQIFSTSTGYGWQVVEIVTVVNNHTVTIQYDFMARHEGTAHPQSVVLSIVHSQQTWYQPPVSGNTFIAQVLPGYLAAITPSTKIHPVGTVQVSLAGAYVTSGAITVNNPQVALGPNGSQQTLADSMTTTYAIQNPEVDRLIPLGTETITFSTSVPLTSPMPAPVSTP